MADESKNPEERFTEFFKFLATVDAAALVGAFTLRRDLGIDNSMGIFSMLMFAVSAYLCCVGMYLLARAPSTAAESKLLPAIVHWSGVLTTSAIVILVISSFFF